MNTIQLMGVASGEWLPGLGILLLLALLIQGIDMGIQYFRKWRRRKFMLMEQSILNEPPQDFSVSSGGNTGAEG